MFTYTDNQIYMLNVFLYVKNSSDLKRAANSDVTFTVCCFEMEAYLKL